MPTPYINKNTRNYLVLDGRVTKAGYDYMKMMNVYWKAGRLNNLDKLH